VAIRAFYDIDFFFCIIDIFDPKMKDHCYICTSFINYVIYIMYSDPVVIEA
jgi:hypothetical protein